MLLWLKRAINAAAFAGGAAQLNGAAWSPWSVENLLSAANRANEPGRYNAYRKLVEEKLGIFALNPLLRETMIDQMMRPEAYQSSGEEQKEDDRNVFEKGWDWAVDKDGKKKGDSVLFQSNKPAVGSSSVTFLGRPHGRKFDAILNSAAGCIDGASPMP